MATKNVALAYVLRACSNHTMETILSPAQCRAARGWLDISQAELAQRAKVGVSTVRDFEAGRKTPIRNNLDAIRRELAKAGVEPTFDSEGQPIGIRAAESLALLDGQ